MEGGDTDTRGQPSPWEPPPRAGRGRFKGRGLRGGGRHKKVSSGAHHRGVGSPGDPSPFRCPPPPTSGSAARSQPGAAGATLSFPPPSVPPVSPPCATRCSSHLWVPGKASPCPSLPQDEEGGAQRCLPTAATWWGGGRLPPTAPPRRHPAAPDHAGQFGEGAGRVRVQGGLF